MAKLSLSLKALEISRKLGIERPLREIYKHSVAGELYYRLARRVLGDSEVVENVQGSRMMLDISGPGLEKDLFLHGVRESESTEILLDELEEGMRVVDVGANVGYYCLMESQAVGDDGKVYAFEPTPTTFERLEENIRLNGYRNVESFNLAVGAEKTSAHLLQSEIANTNRISRSGENTVKVEVKALDSLVEGSVDLVRMDTEGFEQEILEGMEELLSQDSLKLFLELHPRKIEEFYGGSIEEVWEKLSEKDFRVKHLIRHPPRAQPAYFLRKQHPPREVRNPDSPVEEAVAEEQDFLQGGRTFRVFLEK